MKNTKTLPALILLASMVGIGASQAAPLPTNVAAMKGMVESNTALQVRWGGWGGWRGGGWGYRGWRGTGGWGGYRGWGYRGWGAAAAGAIVGGAIASSAYYGGYPYYGGGYGYGDGYGYDYCPPGGGYGYYARPRYYDGW
ncbi:hypothetical protein H8A97_06235 [Bradyrhizobium sp. Arg62]|uniref:hypothetical protein n=1 Tax=Bradyrhizobium brasilense TaxID=1419277 RepID=UPI001E55F261|nr:hypothetical protein [Bradyrhizobium brasilense]MCC8944719.1 hypothetical protein [Bradyrhizobium brasilense]MCP1907949.1 hypothetical protein [Bradyrhizobium elkanii]